MTPTFFDNIRALYPNSPMNGILLGPNSGFKLPTNNVLTKDELSVYWKYHMSHAIDTIEKRADPTRKDVKADEQLKIVLPKFEIWDRAASPAPDEERLLLGTHPEGYYCIYVSRQDMEKMKALPSKFSTTDRGFPKELPKLPNDQYSTYASPTRTIRSANNANVTETEITVKRMDVASITPRYPSQLSVMNDVSATEVRRSFTHGTHTLTF